MHILLIHQAFVALDEAGGTRHYEMALRLAERGHRVTVIASQVSYLTGKAETVSPEAHVGYANQVTILRAYTYKALHRSFVHRVISFFSFMLASFWLGLPRAPGGPGMGDFSTYFPGCYGLGLSTFETSPFSVRSSRPVAGLCHCSRSLTKPVIDSRFPLAGALSLSPGGSPNSQFAWFYCTCDRPRSISRLN